MFLPSVAVFILHKNCTVGSLFLYVCLDLIVAWNSNCPPWEAVADRCLSTAQLIWIISLCSHCFLSLLVMQIIHQVCGYSHWHARILSACYFAVISSCRHVWDQTDKGGWISVQAGGRTCEFVWTAPLSWLVSPVFLCKMMTHEHNSFPAVLQAKLFLPCPTNCGCTVGLSEYKNWFWSLDVQKKGTHI